MRNFFLVVACVCFFAGCNQTSKPTAPAATGSASLASPTLPAPVARTSPTMPARVVRTPIPGAARGGLFEDGVVGLPPADSSGWLTYSNSQYGFSFRYPANWQMAESDSSMFAGAFPRHSVVVQNPATEQGRKIPGQNCSDAAKDCVGLPPGHLSFAVEIVGGACGISGDLVVIDSTFVDGQSALHCVVEYPNDHSRYVAFSLPNPDGSYLQIELEKGNSVTPEQQRVIETILSTVVLTAPGP